MTQEKTELTYDSPQLIIFARFPRLGKVKTRLAKESSDSFSLGLYTSMLLDTLERLESFNNPKSVFFEGCSQVQAESYLSNHFTRLPYSIRPQNGADLGQKMWNACRESKAYTKGTVFLGTDSPTLPLNEIEKALNLVTGRVIVGPCFDGGYYLLAIPTCRKELFTVVPWGTNKVLETTLQKMEPDEFQLLRQWYDIDSINDVYRLCKDLKSSFPGYPQRTADFLRLEGLL